MADRDTILSEFHLIFNLDIVQNLMKKVNKSIKKNKPWKLFQ